MCDLCFLRYRGRTRCGVRRKWERTDDDDVEEHGREEEHEEDLDGDDDAVGDIVVSKTTNLKPWKQ